MDEVMIWDMPSDRQQAADRVAQAITNNTAGQVMSCFTCGHPWFAHYQTRPGNLTGCAATTDCPPQMLAGLLSVDLKVPLLDVDGGCLCPGLVQGHLPRTLTKHLDPLVEDEEDRDCAMCTHSLTIHSERYGCWECPCPIDTAL